MIQYRQQVIDRLFDKNSIPVKWHTKFCCSIAKTASMYLSKEDIYIYHNKNLLQFRNNTQLIQYIKESIIGL